MWPSTEWEKIFASYVSDKVLITRICRALKKLHPPQIQWTNEEVGNWTKQNFFKERNPSDQKAHEKVLTIPGYTGNAIQNHTKILLIPIRIVIIKNTTTNKCWQGCGGKKEPSYITGGNVS
jgi:hypothetical protein